MHGLSGAAGQRADLLKGRAIDQIGPDTIKGNTGAQPAVMERPSVRHPDEQTTNNFRRHSPGFLLWICRLAKEMISFSSHGRLLSVAEAYACLRFRNRISVNDRELILFLMR